MQSFSKGATIIKKGSVGTTLYLMDTGSARVEVRQNDIRKHIIHSMHSGLPSLKTRFCFSHPRKRQIGDYYLVLKFFEPVGRDHELMEIHSGRYFGEIAFSATVKNLLQAEKKIMIQECLWLNL